MLSLLLFLQRCSGVLLRCRSGPPRGTASQCRSGPPRGTASQCRSGPLRGTALEAQKQKIGSQCNFFAITDCLEFPNCESSRKNQGNWLYCGPILLFGNGKSSAIAKKLKKCRDFCFCSGLIAETRRIPREEHGVCQFRRQRVIIGATKTRCRCCPLWA